MAIFNRNPAPAPVDKADGLPAGYDQPESEFYVPAEYRDYYRAAEVDAGAVLERLDEIVRADARQALYAENTGPDRNGRPMVNLPLGEEFVMMLDRRVAEAKRGNLDELFARATHSLRADSASAAKKADDHRAERSAQQAALETCPVCLERNVTENGFVRFRDLQDGRSQTQLHALNSCFSCFDEARMQRREALARVVVRDKLTRAQVVADALGIS